MVLYKQRRLRAKILGDHFLNVSQSADGFNGSLSFEFRLKAHLYCYKILCLGLQSNNTFIYKHIFIWLFIQTKL